MQSRTITPADVVARDQALVNLRNNRRAARPTILPVLEYENLEDPLHPDERTIRIILANESDLLDAKQAAARETDATLYQVEISRVRTRIAPTNPIGADCSIVSAQ